MKRISAKSREVSDENYRTDRAREILRHDCEGEPDDIVADNCLPGKGEIGDPLQNAADPKTGCERISAGDSATREPADQGCSKADAFMIAAYSFLENPRSITNGAVMMPASASVNLNRITKIKPPERNPSIGNPRTPCKQS